MALGLLRQMPLFDEFGSLDWMLKYEQAEHSPYHVDFKCINAILDLPHMRFDVDSICELIANPVYRRRCKQAVVRVWQAYDDFGYEPQTLQQAMDRFISIAFDFLARPQDNTVSQFVFAVTRYVHVSPCGSTATRSHCSDDEWDRQVQLLSAFSSTFNDTEATEQPTDKHSFVVLRGLGKGHLHARTHHTQLHTSTTKVVAFETNGNLMGACKDSQDTMEDSVMLMGMNILPIAVEHVRLPGRHCKRATPAEAGGSKRRRVE